MPWNWQLPEWPNFKYDHDKIIGKEKKFLLNLGSSFAYLSHISKTEQDQYIIEILSQEGLESSKIEGEILERGSLQSSIRRHFGLQAPKHRLGKESGMAELLCSVYETYDKPLTHKMLWKWHSMLFKGWAEFDSGKYRSHPEPMQIVSGRLDLPKVFFEAPPSKLIQSEMTKFINWFNAASPSEPILGRAAVAHLYFENIHPFEDGNGRIGRILVEKVLSQGVGKPALIAVSKFIEKQRQKYYAELGKCNRTLNAAEWVNFFADTVLQAQEYSNSLLHFLIIKSKMLTKLAGQLNQRQEKALLRMFAEGPEGFVGGLSAENYISITKASRATATRDLADLVQKKALINTGELRHTRYWLISPSS